jgi:acyl-CoA synthetase (AMP-forming)/AMP-acid ligase II
MRDLSSIVPGASWEPAATAVRAGELVLTYADLHARVETLSAALMSVPGAVGIRSPNEPAFLVAFLACLRAGRPAVLLDVVWTDEDLHHAASEVGVALLVESTSDERPGAAAAFGAERLALAPDGRIEALTAGDTPTAPDPLAVVHWSSGSTGRPKAIGVTRAMLSERLAALRRAVVHEPTDRTLCILPLSHCHGVECIAIPALAAGGELVLMDPRTATVERVCAAIEAHAITMFSALPRLYAEICAGPSTPSDLRSLRLAMCGSAALPPDVSRVFHARFGLPIGQGYGLTEIGVISLNLHADPPSRYDSVGPVLEGIEWRLESPDRGGVGELVVRSPGCAPYLRGGAERPGGWLATGDLVRGDPDGYLYVVGRRSSFLNLNGAKADPAEIEAAVSELDWVAECAVRGVVGPDGVERAAAYVVTRPGRTPAHTTESVQHAAAERLSIFKVPAFVVELDALPRTSMGKVAYAMLPAPEAPSPAPRGAPPSSSLESAVAEEWCAVLKVESVGSDQGLAALGGTSVHVIALLEALNERFGCALTVVDMFRYPTVAAQAARIGGTKEQHGLDAATERGRLRRAARTWRARGPGTGP